MMKQIIFKMNLVLRLKYVSFNNLLIVDNDVMLYTCRWFPAGIHKLDNNRRVYINAFELLHVITEYLVSFFNDGCYRIIYYSFIDIYRQVSILN